MNIRVAGFGGQGIILAGYVLGRAGTIAGLNALQTQSYGSESRGGACKSDVIISADEILELAPAQLDVFLAMSQPAYDKYMNSLTEEGTLIYDADLVKPSAAGNGGRAAKSYAVPAGDIAHNTFGSDVIANIVMLGFLGAVTGVVEREPLRKAVEESVPPKTIEMNLRAFDEGYRRGETAG